MNWRAVGCGAVGAAVFVAVGLLGMSLAFSRFDGCPPRLQWDERAYLPSGSPSGEPSLGEGEAVELGSTFVGLTTRRVFGPPGSAVPSRTADRPAAIALECGDGTYQAYRWEATGPTPGGSRSATP